MEYIEYTRKNNLTNNDLLNLILSYNNIDDLSILSSFSFPYFYKDYLSFIETVDKNQRIAIIGDYDCDGICATSIMMMFLRYLKKDVTYIIGNRTIDGYGLNERLIDNAIAYKASLIITVDNGINCKKQVEYAKSQGLDVIITDHHLASSDLPDCPIFNPHLENIAFKNVCGAFVALTLVLNYFNHKKIIEKNLMNAIYELAALATISDVMPLYDINRKIVLKLINDINNNTIYQKGIKALVKKLKITQTSSTNIAFNIVPLINAAGRLDDASIVVSYFVDEQDENIIKTIMDLNEKRKSLTATGLSQIRLDKANINICYVEDMHEGILGIISSKLVEKTGRPSLVFTNSNGLFKGSGRSIKEFDLHEAISNMNVNYSSFGGHREAIGISFDNVEDFTQFKFDMQRLEVPSSVCYYIRNSTSLKETYSIISSLEPLGEGVKVPPFYIQGKIENVRLLGNKHTSFQMSINGNLESFIYFNCVLEEGNYAFLYNINKEEFRGKINYKGFIKSIIKEK